jgi:hypothetical protein
VGGGVKVEYHVGGSSTVFFPFFYLVITEFFFLISNY